MGELTCPKCPGAMRTYERAGVTVDQCTECRGIFLDRGELEKLIDAESAHHARPVAAVPDRDYPERRMEAPRYEPRPDDRYRGDGYRGDSHRGDSYRGDGYRGDGYRDDYYKKKKRKSFLEELFD